MFDRIYDVLYYKYGADFYYFALMVIAGPATIFFTEQMSAVQDLFQLIGAIGIELGRIFALFAFMMDNRRPLLAMIQQDQAGGMTTDSWNRIYAGTRWFAYIVSIWLCILNIPQYWSYAITYMQQYGATTPRSVLIITMIIFYGLAQIFTYMLFGLRYCSSGKTGRNLREFHIFGFSIVFVSYFVPLTVLAWLLVVPSFTAGY